MVKKDYCGNTDKKIENIMFRKDIGKREKIKLMFYLYEKKYPNDDKELLIKTCIKYYEYKIEHKSINKYFK